MPRGLSNKVALITGAAQGIGRGIALRLAQEGVHLALVDLSADKLKNQALVNALTRSRQRKVGDKNNGTESCGFF